MDKSPHCGLLLLYFPVNTRFLPQAKQAHISDKKYKR